jgi:uncharacterized protein (DUF58 family)
MLSKELMREVRRLQVRTNRRVDNLFAGEYKSAFKGQGVEFAEVREYEPGDDIRSIDWNVSARTGSTFIKRYIEERQLTVIIAVDLSASESFGARGKFKSRLAVEVGAALCLAATRSNDLAGLQVFTDRVESFVPPRNGRGHALRIMRDLLEFEPVGLGTDLALAIDHLNRVLSRHAVVFLISDFQAPAHGESGYAKPLRRLASRHEVVAVRTEDPTERELPNVGLIRVRDPETGREALIDTASKGVRTRARAEALRADTELERTLRIAKADLVRVSTDRPFVRDLEACFRMRERRR